jgi:hypothetical protein
MKYTLILLLFSSPALAQTDLQSRLADCQRLSDDTARLACYDRLSSSKPVANEVSETQQTDVPEVSHIPPLLADLNEPTVFVSYGELDFLGDEKQAVLLGIGKRQLIREFSGFAERPLAFNVFGLIRSQFDVDQLDTRNNRGGALINTDFAVGGELVQSYEHWNWRFSYTHRSTHLGDEFLIDNPEFAEQRINLSYETVGWLAHKPLDHWDLYAGLSLVTRSEPGDLSEVMWQAGWQYHGPEWWSQVSPLWAVDLTTWGAYDWNINLNMRAGVEITGLSRLPVQLYLEYFDGHAPYGQFFTEDLSYAGITLIQHW